MKLSRFATVSTLALAGALALAACGSDNTSDKSKTSNAASGGASSSGPKVDCGSGSLQAAGSSAQKPAFGAWVSAYQQECGNASINYDGQGSGEGITQFTQGQVPLAGSDSHLKSEEQAPADKRCTGGKAVDIPMVATPVAIIYNLKGVSGLTLTPSTIAKIFSGKIKKWNDPAIAASNKGATLPSTSITPVHRSKDSGTTDNFTKFLAAQAPSDWKYPGGKAWSAPGGLGGADSTALVGQVKSTDGGIGYVDSPDATKNKFTPAKIDAGAGPVELTQSSVDAGIAAAQVVQKGQDIQVNLNYGLKTKGAYPALLVTYEITCTKGLAADQGKFVKSFLTYTASKQGQALLGTLGHFALPPDLISKVQQSVSQLSSS